MTRFNWKLVNAGLALLASVAASAAFAFERPDYVRVRRIAYAGTGCPAGSVAENVSPDLKAFTLLFDNFVAEASPGLPLSETRKNCSINVDLDFPNGWSYTLIDVDYRGFASLERGVTGVQKSSYYFQGQAQTASLQTTLVGPLTRDYQIRDTLGLSAQVWSPCGAQRSLNINTQVRVDNSRAGRFGSGMLTIDSIDGQLKHIYGIQWRRCR